MKPIDNPILNSPFHEPTSHFAFDDRGVITGDIQDGRRPSQYFTPIPGTKKKASAAPKLDLGDDAEQVKENELINQVRGRVELWRAQGYPGITGTTRRLLEHWNVIEDRTRPLFFCQREAIETAVYLTEAAPKDHVYLTSTLAQYDFTAICAVVVQCH